MKLIYSLLLALASTQAFAGDISSIRHREHSFDHWTVIHDGSLNDPADLGSERYQAIDCSLCSAAALKETLHHYVHVRGFCQSRGTIEPVMRRHTGRCLRDTKLNEPICANTITWDMYCR